MSELAIEPLYRYLFKPLGKGRYMGRFLFFIVRPVLAIMYTAGLGLLIPYLLVLGLPAEVEGRVPSFSLPLLGGAIALIAIAVFATFLLRDSYRQAVRSIALYSFIPGALAGVVFFYGRDTVMRSVAQYGSEVEAFVSLYLDSKIPQIGYLAAAYVLVGIALLWLSRKV